MSKDAYNLARISLGEPGMTAYFVHDSYESMPETIVWDWDSGIRSTHVKGKNQSYGNATQKEWWDKYVRNMEWPDQARIEDLFEDVWMPLNTRTYRYTLTDKKKLSASEKKKKSSPKKGDPVYGVQVGKVSVSPLDMLDMKGTPFGVLHDYVKHDAWMVQQAFLNTSAYAPVTMSFTANGSNSGAFKVISGAPWS